ncbi:peptidoglycan-binding protein LysM [Flavobacterium franklandianum]|uniref:Peptidoglycan-binding protein LysM n=1 Tax=Flavobacterium franklandianum TaxID=2594430 RepID=A0A553CR03_9FLAO|nr:peptidoglycan-binding protein LysM [Flavobacterium franklandianum]TRX22968.1 peptidoglycan-binding protein LysM [Flavobacterium franklandianum]
MINKWSFYTSLTIIIAFLSSGFKPFKQDSNQWFLTDETEGAHYLFPSLKQEECSNLNVPYTGKFFIGYKEAIAFKESQGKYRKINSLGYMGKYQFGKETLKTVGIHDSSRFLNSPKMQEKAFVALISKNKSELKDIIQKHEGQIITGVLVTESGILAAAHLGGVGSVKRFFRHKGKRYFKDAYGTSIRSYMRDFGGYETSGIVADCNAKVKI